MHVPYVHEVSHKLKKAAGRAEVSVVFSAPKKLNVLYRKVYRDEPPKRRGEKKHLTPITSCIKGVVYEIPLRCSHCWYLEQTGHCPNDFFREHYKNVKQMHGSNLPLHLRSCNCTLNFNQVTVITKHADQRSQDISEAFAIIKQRP